MWMPLMRATDGSTLVVVARTLMGINREDALARAERAKAVLADWQLEATGDAIDLATPVQPVVRAMLSQQVAGVAMGLEVVILSGPMMDAARAEAHAPTTPTVEGNDV